MLTALVRGFVLLGKVVTLSVGGAVGLVEQLG
jgi:hypothetical protein